MSFAEVTSPQAPQAAQPLLSMSGISKSFSGVAVLRDVAFDLRPGEVHVLAGENGAGKSTLIKIVAGVHTDYDGSIHLYGRPARFDSPHDANQRGISVIHQEMSLIDAMSVVDNMFLGRELTRSGSGAQWLDRQPSSGVPGSSATSSAWRHRPRPPGGGLLALGEEPDRDRQGPGPGARASSSWTSPPAR